MTARQANMQQFEHWEPHDANAALRNQITRTRADLGDTLSELAARTDVKARARQAVSQARDRTRAAVRERVRSATMRTSSAAQTGASSARQMLDRVGRTPVMIGAGAGAGALMGLGIYALLRNRLPFQPAWLRKARGRLRLARTGARAARAARTGTRMARGRR